MKKKVLVFLLFISILFINIDVKAASNNDLNNLLLDSIPSNNKICVYATSDFKARDMNDNPLRDEFKYIVLVFSKNGNAYDATDYSFAVKDATFKPTIYLVPSISGGSSTFPTNNCNDYYPYIQTMPTGEYNFYIADSKTVSATKYFYQYNESATKIVTQNTTQLEEGNSLENCSYTVGNDSIRLVNYVDGDAGFTQNNYFTTNLDNRLACPATTEVTNNTISFYSRIKVDIKSFDCSAWRLIENPFVSTMDSNCYYYLVDKYQQVHDNTQEKVEGDVITKYLAYSNANAETINIMKTTDGSYRAVFDKDKRYIAIANISEYASVFASGNTSSYPTWINTIENEDGSTSYQLSNEKNKTSRINYICQAKIKSSLELGGTLVNDTCEDIIGPEFLEFLNNNVITVIRLGIPLLLILFTTFDFAKIVFVDDKEAIPKATKRFGKRIVAALLIYLIPALLIFVVKIIGANQVDECIEYFNNAASETETK